MPSRTSRSRRAPPPPRISVVVCSHNGGRTIRDTLRGLRALDYPDYQVIVVDDGSTDGTAAIAGEYDVQLIRHPANRGLSAARNTGLAAATGDIVAYIDDDAYPDPHWLTYLAETFQQTSHAGVGGPNIAPPGDGTIADAVANAPGGPTHVLLSDSEAEHVPGCNMAFRRDALSAIGGFDAQFRAAGDDVDVCWRIRDRGWTLGFSPAAVVWHHRRNSVRAYWRQQRGYGKAEALLARKWPHRYNEYGHTTWAGRVYGKGLAQRLFGRGRIYHGTWGAAPFQSLYEPAHGPLSDLPRMPEWYLLLLSLGALSALGWLWAPLWWALLPFALGAAATITQGIASAWHASFSGRPHGHGALFALRLLTAALHLLQPAARLWGRIRYGTCPWRLRTEMALGFPRSHTRSIWSDQAQPAESRLAALEQALRAAGAYVLRGGDFDRWDLDVRAGALTGARLLMAVEEHGGGRQYVRLRCWPSITAGGAAAWLLLAGLAVAAALGAADAAALVLGGACVTMGAWMLIGCNGAMVAIRRAVPPFPEARRE